MDQKLGLLRGVLTNKCPYCYRGAVFRGLLSMNKRCPNCDGIFLKEEGYYIGSMIVAYFFSAFSAIPIFVLGVFVANMEVGTLIFLCSLQVIILSPIFYRYATILWLWGETIFSKHDSR